MIQRIQTVFLGAVAGLMFASIFLGVWSMQGPNGASASLDAFALSYRGAGGESDQMPAFYLAGLCFVAAAVAVGSLLSYKNRKLQLKLNMLNTVMILIVVGLNVYLTLAVGGSYFENAEGPGAFQAGFFLPPVAALCNSMASRFILRDEKLVKSMDRIR